MPVFCSRVASLDISLTYHTTKMPRRCWHCTSRWCTASSREVRSKYDSFLPQLLRKKVAIVSYEGTTSAVKDINKTLPEGCFKVARATMPFRSAWLSPASVVVEWPTDHMQMLGVAHRYAVVHWETQHAILGLAKGYFCPVCVLVPADYHSSGVLKEINRIAC